MRSPTLRFPRHTRAIVIVAGMAVIAFAASPAPVATVTASAHQGEHVAARTLDDNLLTRWSAEGNGQWILYDLGALRALASVEIAFPNGDTRNALFTLEVSQDGEQWTEVFEGQSNGKTSKPERFGFPTVTARFVRYTGWGNSDNAWNSISEFVFNFSPFTPTNLRP